MQNQWRAHSNIIIADYQVITDRDTTEHIQDNVLNLILDYMAAGIDPDKTMIYTHSAVPAENQLMLPFLSLVTESELHRNPTVKAEMEASGHALTGLLLTYPVHQACDILFCKANVVPIGKDQPAARRNRPAPSPAASTSVTPRRTRCSRSLSAILSDAPEIPGLDGQQDEQIPRQLHHAERHRSGDRQAHQEEPRPIPNASITFDPIARPEVSALLTTAGADHRPRPEGNRRGNRRLRCRRAEEVRDRIREQLPCPACANAAPSWPKIWITCVTCSHEGNKKRQCHRQRDAGAGARRHGHALLSAFEPCGRRTLTCSHVHNEKWVGNHIGSRPISLTNGGLRLPPDAIPLRSASASPLRRFLRPRGRRPRGGRPDRRDSGRIRAALPRLARA